MKKLLFQILFLLPALSSMSQAFLLVSGTVTELNTGNPIANQAVIIHNDSSSGTYFYHTTLTNSSGFYMDTIINGGSQGNLYVGTVDCQNYMHLQSFVYTPALNSFTADFAICYSNNPCAAGFTHQQTQPLTVQFTDASTGGGNLRNWMFGDGSTSSQANPSHTYSVPGYYDVTLTIGALGTTCYNAVTQTILVQDSTGGGCQAAFVMIPDSVNTPPNTFYFEDYSSGNNIHSYFWNFGDGTSQYVTFPGNPNVVHTYLQAGTYTACLTIQSADSSCYDMTCLTFVIGSGGGCQANFTEYSDSVNTTNQYHFIDMSAGNIISWNWNFGDPASGPNNISSVQNPAHIFTVPGTYNVCLTIHGADTTCYDVTCHTIVVGGGSGCQANFSYGTDPALGDHTIAFTDLSSGNPTAWSWSFGDGTAGTVQNPVHTYAGPGTYIVCLTITGNNCTSTFCQNVVITDSTAYHQVYGQVFAGNFPVTDGLAMIFSVDTTGSYTPYVAVFPLDSNGVYYFTMVPDGNYYILAIPFDPSGYLPTYYGNTISWTQATLISLGTPNNPYNINLVLSDQMTPGPGSASGQINMGDVSNSMVDKVNMILLNSQGKAIGFTPVSTTGEFDFSTLAYGTYYLHAEMPGITSDYVMFTVSAAKPHTDVVMTFTGNKILGIGETAALASSWSVFPNPVVEKLTINIELKQGINAEAGIYDMTGRLVENKRVFLNEGINTIDISTASLPSGIYFLRLFSKEGLLFSTKLVKTQ
ncbi:MAG: PKD domain-containing protein [bacterium]